MKAAGYVVIDFYKEDLLRRVVLLESNNDPEKIKQCHGATCTQEPY